MTSHFEPDTPVVRPRRQIRLPAHLADYQVTDSTNMKRALPLFPPTAESVSQSSSPESQSPYPDGLLLCDEWPDLAEDVAPEYNEPRQDQHLFDIKAMWTEMKRDSNELRSHILPEILSTLRGLQVENVTLKQEIQQIATERVTPGRPVKPVPAPRTHVPSSVHRQRGSTEYAGEVPLDRFAQYEQLTKQMGDFTFSPRPEHPYAGRSRPVPSQRSYAHSVQPVTAVQHDNEPLSPRSSYRQSDRDFQQTPCPELTSRSEMQPVYEQVYQGPKPTIPRLTAADPRQFSRLRMALENLLPMNASERFKYQILTDHLELEEALLVADSYCNSVRPYTDTMQALVKMYGQPHKLVLRNIAEVLEGPNLKPGDVKAFKFFALRVRSLVSMLEQLGSEGASELECGSHVSRLQGKLPHELQISFKRYVHPSRITVPTLIDFADWLEYELQVQDDLYSTLSC